MRVHSGVRTQNHFVCCFLGFLFNFWLASFFGWTDYRNSTNCLPLTKWEKTITTNKLISPRIDRGVRGMDCVQMHPYGQWSVRSDAQTNWHSSSACFSFSLCRYFKLYMLFSCHMYVQHTYALAIGYSCNKHRNNIFSSLTQINKREEKKPAKSIVDI